MKTISYFAVAAVLGFAVAAFADRTFTITNTKAEMTTGLWQRNPDGGFHMECCLSRASTKDGKGAPVEKPCVTTDVKAWGEGLSQCSKAWLKANVE